MSSRAKGWLPRVLVAAGAAALVAAVVVATAGPPPPTPNPPGTFAFAAMGDAPYYPWEEWQFRLVRQALDAHDLAFVIEVGDIFWRPCTDKRYRQALDELDGLGHPVVFTPGDNEWTDCWEPGSGGYAPLERLDRLREIFFRTPERSLGARPLALASQAADASYGQLVENARWTYEGIVFATLHLPGSQNAMKPFPARTRADDAAAAHRTRGAVVWLHQTFEAAVAAGAGAVVLAFHAAPGFEDPVDHPYRRSYDPFITTLEDEVERFGKPVLMIHGDDHEFVVDHPLARRTTGRILSNLTRLQVPGSPEVGWVRVVVTPGERPTFAFESHVVPAWKYW